MKATFARLVMLGLLGSAALAAQTPAPPGQAADEVHTFTEGARYTIHHNVSLVILDGVAVDAKGNAITDLKQSEFHITEDGAPQTIRNFDVPGKYVVDPTVTIESTSDLNRLAPRAPVNIVLLDEFSTRFEDMAFARYSLKKWLDAQPVKLDTPTMLVAVSLDKFEVLRDYTQNKDEILNSLNNHFAAYPWQLHQITWSPEQYSAAHLALRRVAEATAGHPGHKTMIWIGRGFPSNRNFGQGTKVETDDESLTSRTLNELRDARVTLYTIDPAGVMIDPGSAYPSPGWFYWPFGGDQRFMAMALATGGRNFAGRNDVDAEIGTSLRDGKSFYTLTYIPPNPDTEIRKLRHIKVTIDRPGVTFISRSAYFPDGHMARTNQDGTMGRQMQAELVAAGLTNLKYDNVNFSATMSETDPNEVRIHIDGRRLSYVIPKDESQPRYTEFTVLATTFDAKHKSLKAQVATYKHTVEDAPHYGPVNRPADALFKINPDPKAVSVRFVVRIDGPGSMGSVDMPLKAGAKAESVAAEAAAQASTPTAPSKETAAPAATPPPAS